MSQGLAFVTKCQKLLNGLRFLSKIGVLRMETDDE